MSLFLVFLSAICLSACGGVDPVVEIGLVAPFEGRYRDVGYDVIYSARLVIHEVNAAGGVGPYRVELVALDDFGDPESAKQVAESLAINPDVVAVVGHWLPESTAAAQELYQQAGLAQVAGGEGQLGQYPADELPLSFQSAYESVTPFDEEPGDFAGAAYDGMYLVVEAMRRAWENDGVVSREGVAEALEHVTFDGVTGTVHKP